MLANGVPGRFTAGLQATISFDRELAAIGDARWGVISAKNGGLISADVPARQLWIPLTPEACLVAGYRDVEAKSETIEALNADAWEQARDFVFGEPRVIERFAHILAECETKSTEFKTKT